jgi:hypothetical protein
MKMNNRCEHKGHVYTSIKKYFTFAKTNIFDVYAKFALKWQTLIGINTLT